MPNGRTPPVGISHSAARQFLETVFDPSDWAAVFLKSYETTGFAQRVGPVSWVKSVHVQQWLCAMNSQKYNIFISVNAIAPGRRSRTRCIPRPQSGTRAGRRRACQHLSTASDPA